jgi:hypothetical protein
VAPEGTGSKTSIESWKLTPMRVTGGARRYRF